jgi:hypothetical protein
MGTVIFLSYRREDSAQVTANIKNWLVEHGFPAEAIFYNYSTIQAGQRWDQKIQTALEHCRVVIAVIGPNWVTCL